MIDALEFDLHSVLPIALLESYSVAVGLCDDLEVLHKASYLIDLSLLSSEY